MCNASLSLFTAICLIFILLGCQPANVSMTVVTKGSADNTFTVQKIQLKAVQKNVVGTYGKVISAKAIGYIKGGGVIFDSIVEINSKYCPAKLIREVKMTWDKNKAPAESVNGPSPGEIVLVVSVNGIYYDNTDCIKITSPAN